MSRICELALTLGDFSGSKNPKATIRNCIYTHPLDFISSEQKDYWQLASYQEEVAGLKREIEELKGQLAKKDKTIEELKAVPKEAEFVEKFLREVMDEYKRKPKQADPIRNILRHMRHKGATAVLDAWIDEKEDELKRALEKLKIQIHNVTMTGNQAKYIEISNEKEE